MTTHEPQEPKNNEQLRVMYEGVEQIKEIAGVPLEQPGERRADSGLPEGYVHTEEKEAEIRSIAAEKLGIGLTEDLTLEKAGLSKGGLAIIEGGQSHKMLAELVVALEGDYTGPIVIASTEHRAIKQTADDEKVRERANTAALLGIVESQVGDTELAVAVQVAESLPGFEPAGDTTNVDGLVRFGVVNGRDIFAYAIPRTYYTDEQGAQKYSQPNAVEQAQYLKDTLGATEAALVTSSTYFSSRAVSSKGAFMVAAYCPMTLARVRGQEPSTAQPDFAQILSEVAKTDSLFQ